VHGIDPKARIVNLATFEPAVHVEELNPFLQGMSAAMAKVTGTTPRFLGRPAGSDGRHFAMVRNDIVEYGIYGQGSHSDEEYAEIDSFAEYQAVLRAFLRAPLPKKLKVPKEAATEPLQEKLLRKLVAIPSTPNDRAANNKVLDIVEKFASERGMYIERFEQNDIRTVIATTKRHAKRPLVLLNAHSDVVPGPVEMFDLQLKEGKFIGRGVMDMKHAIAAYLTVVDRLKDEINDYDFGLMINSDEEVGGENGAKPLVEKHGYGAEVVIVPDGGNHWELEHFAKGVYWIKLEASGVEAHASRPWEGESAIHRLLGALKDIRQLVVEHPKPEDTLLSVGTIEGGKTANQLAAYASAMIDVRTGSVEDHQRILTDIETICRQHDITMSVAGSGSPIVTDPKAPYIKEFVEIVEQVTGRSYPTRYDFAVTDGRFFNAAGVPTIVINPECDAIHTPQEWLSQKSFAQFCDVLEQYVRRMARVQHTTVSRSLKTHASAPRLDRQGV
jgi:acetylornithine deacetylase/succinyl-diaminopimelate desuccinylase-like protein